MTDKATELLKKAIVALEDAAEDGNHCDLLYGVVNYTKASQEASKLAIKIKVFLQDQPIMTE